MLNLGINMPNSLQLFPQRPYIPLVAFNSTRECLAQHSQLLYAID